MRLRLVARVAFRTDPIVLRWHAARLAGPLLRTLPPHWRLRLYRGIVGRPFRAGVFGDRVERRVWPHGYVMRLDLSDWMERCAAITALFYGIDTTLVLQQRLAPGSVFLDIGGNLGFLSLTAAALVGEQGRVIHVEPNPVLVARLRETLARNAIGNVAIVEAAIGEREGETALTVPIHHGKTYLAEGAGTPMRTGDSLLPLIPDGAPLLVKIDVEGYEEKVLLGMPALRARPDTAFLIEITDAWLRLRGGSARALIELMAGDGFIAHHVGVARDGSLQLTHIREPLPLKQYDLLFTRGIDAAWIHPDGPESLCIDSGPSPSSGGL